MWHGTFQKVRRRLEIGIEDDNKLIILNIATIHCRLEITGFITISKNSMPVNNTGAILLPLLHLFLDQGLRRNIIGVIENLNEHIGFWPV